MNSKQKTHEDVRAHVSHFATALFCLSAALMIGGVAWMVTPPSDSSVRNAVAAKSLHEVAESFLGSISGVVEPAMARTNKIAKDPEIIAAVRSGDRDRLTALADRQVVGNTEIDALALFDKSGEILAINHRFRSGEQISNERIDRVLKRDYSERPIIQDCLKNTASEGVLEFQTQCDITPALFDSSGLSVAYSVPIYDNDGVTQIGVASSRLRFDRLSRLIDNRKRVRNGPCIYFVTENGGFFDEGINSGKSVPPIDSQTLAGMAKPLLTNRVESTFAPYETNRGQRMYAAITPLRSIKTIADGGILVMLAADDKFVASAARQKQVIAGLVIVTVALLLAGIGGAVRSSTRLRTVNIDLVGARNAAQSADRAKSEFLANMSHEIRTPLTAILGFADTLAEKTIDDEGKDAVSTIRRNGTFLLELINDILDLSKVEAGKMEVESIEASPGHVVAEVASLMGVRADEYRVDLKFECVGPIPESIHTDPTRLRQVLINLVGNAIKFTEGGKVRLVMSHVENNGKSMLQFDVEDNGIGMSEATVDRLFKPFTQADSSTTRTFGGTGLGLTISKRFAEMLGGDLFVLSSKPGEGTTFRLLVETGPLDGVKMREGQVHLLAIEDPTSPAHQSDNASIEGVKLLVAEDGPDNQRLIQMFLKKAGATVKLVENGKLAVDAALSQAEAGIPYDAVLMDMQMPVMDGYEATKTLRRSGFDRPIIALTAHAMNEDRQKCLDAGCSDYVSKPIDRKVLVATIARQVKDALVSV